MYNLLIDYEIHFKEIVYALCNIHLQEKNINPNMVQFQQPILRHPGRKILL